MLRLSTFLLVFVCSFLWAQNPEDRSARTKQTNDEESFSKFVRRWSGDDVVDPRQQPLYLSAGALELQENQGGMFQWLLTGGVKLRQGDKPQALLELLCDRALVWFQPSSSKEATSGNVESRGQTLDFRRKLEQALFYAEGNVSFRWAGNTFKGAQIFFDLLNNRGIVVKGRLLATTEFRDRKIPLHLKAEELLIYSQQNFVAKGAAVSTCQFGDPHYHFAAEEVRVARERQQTYIEAYDNVLYGMKTPLLFSPYLGGASGQNWPLKSVKAGRSSRYGYFLDTLWGGNIYENKEQTSGSKLEKLRWLLELSAREERGFAAGPHVLYNGTVPRESTFTGRFDSYYFHDQPLDELGQSLDGNTSDDNDKDEATRSKRYRFYWLHRHKFPDNWSLDIELSHLSDRTLLRDFFDREEREEKEPETYGYVKKTWERHAFTVLARSTLNDFLDQVAYLPQINYDVLYEPVWQEVLGPLYWSSHAEISNVRREDDQDDPSQFDGERNTRMDWDNVLFYRWHLDPLYVMPFVSGRLGYFEKGLVEDNLFRQTAAMGAEVATNFYRLFFVNSELLQIRRMLHVFTPNIRYQWIYENTVDPNELIPYDELETIDQGQQIRFRLTNRLKTVRDNKIVDFVFFEAELVYFPDRNLQRTSLGLPVSNRWEKFNNLKLDLRWQIRDNFAIEARAEHNFQARELERAFVEFSYEPTENWQFAMDTRYQLISLNSRDSELINTCKISYIPNKKWAFWLSVQHEFRDNFNDEEFRDIGFTIRRIFHRFALDLRIRQDIVDDNTSVSVNFFPIDLVADGSLDRFRE